MAQRLETVAMALLILRPSTGATGITQAMVKIKAEGLGAWTFLGKIQLLNHGNIYNGVALSFAHTDENRRSRELPP